MNKLTDFIKYHWQTIVIGAIVLISMVSIFYYSNRNVKQEVEDEKLTASNVVGEVKYVKGDTETILENGSAVFCGGTFYVGENASVSINFNEGKDVKLMSNSIVEVESKNSIDDGNSMDGYMHGGSPTVKSYTVTITQGEAVIDIRNISEKAYFMVVTPELKYSTGATKTRVCRREDYGVTYVTVDRGDIEFKEGSTHKVSQGQSVYSKGDGIDGCKLMTLEKKDAYVFSYTENESTECYTIYSGDRVAESNIYYPYPDDFVDVTDLELTQQVYDFFDEIYTKAMKGETLIEVTAPSGVVITVHIKEIDNGIATFDPINFSDIWEEIHML